MIKRLLSGSVIALLIAFGVPAIASAHVLKVDGDIGAVLHINPDDNPTTGSSTDYVMSFNDDTGKFSLPKCNCNVSIIENNKIVATKPLVVSSSEISENHYTFLKPDVYTMRFTGAPKQHGAFQPFTLDYEERITGGSPPQQNLPVWLWVGMGMGMGLILLAGYAMSYDTDEVVDEGKR